MEKMKRVLALLLVCAMLMPNLTIIASATDLGEDPAAVSTEPVVVAEEPEETEATEAATEAPTEPATEATEAPASAAGKSAKGVFLRFARWYQTDRYAAAVPAC